MKAQAAAKSKTVSYDPAHNVRNNAKLAAQELVRVLGWHGVWVQGDLPNGDAVFVQVSPESFNNGDCIAFMS